MKRKLIHRRWFKSLVYTIIVFAIAAIVALVMAKSIGAFGFVQTWLCAAFLTLWWVIYRETR